VTVRELVAFLKFCDPNAVVLVDGYEGGMEYLRKGQIEYLKFREDEDIPGDCSGNLKEIGAWDSDYDRDNAFMGIVFHRKRGL